MSDRLGRFPVSMWISNPAAGDVCDCLTAERSVRAAEGGQRLLTPWRVNYLSRFPLMSPVVGSKRIAVFPLVMPMTMVCRAAAGME